MKRRNRETDVLGERRGRWVVSHLSCSSISVGVYRRECIVICVHLLLVARVCMSRPRHGPPSVAFLFRYESERFTYFMRGSVGVYMLVYTSCMYLCMGEE